MTGNDHWLGNGGVAGIFGMWTGVRASMEC